MKRLYIPFLAFFLFFNSCNYPGDGALGGWDIIEFKTSEAKLKQAIDSLYKLEPSYKTKGNWKYESNEWLKDHYYLNTVIFYFNSPPEEMYYVTYVDNGNGDNPNFSRLAIRAVQISSNSWKRYQDVSKNEKLRIEKRFHKYIVKRLEMLTKVESSKIPTSH